MSRVLITIDPVGQLGDLSKVNFAQLVKFVNETNNEALERFASDDEQEESTGPEQRKKLFDCTVKAGEAKSLRMTDMALIMRKMFDDKMLSVQSATIEQLEKTRVFIESQDAKLLLSYADNARPLVGEAALIAEIEALRAKMNDPGVWDAILDDAGISPKGWKGLSLDTLKRLRTQVQGNCW